MRKSGVASALGLAWACVAVGIAVAGRQFRLYPLLYLPFGWAIEPAAPTAAELRSAGELSKLFAAGFLPSLAYLAIGLLLLRMLRARLRGVERLAVGWLVGSGAASLLILGLRSLGISLPLGLLLIVGAAGLAIDRTLRSPENVTASAPQRSRASSAIDAATLVTAAFLILSAFGPEVSWDALEYHLPMVKAWSEGPIRPLPGIFDSELRTGVDLLFLPAVAAGASDAAAVVTAAFSLAMCAIVRAQAARSGSPTVAASCGLLVLLAPIVLTHAPTCYTDLAVGATGFAALLFAYRWNCDGERWQPLLAVILAAFAANAKLHAAVILPAVFLLLLCGGRRPALLHLGFLAGVAGMLVLPWFVKSALATGNPFFPLFGDRFGWGPSDAAHVAIRAQQLARDLPAELRSLPAYLHELAFGHHPYLGGLLGPLPLAFAPLAIRRLDRATAALAGVSGCLFALQLHFAPSLRFGFPLLPFVALATAEGARALASSGPPARFAVAGLCAGVALFQAASAVGAYAPRLQALRAPRPYERAVWPAEDSLRRMVARAEAVVAIPMGAVLWMPKPVYLLIGERNGEMFAGRDSPRHVLGVLERRGVRSFVLPVRVPVTFDGSIDHRLFGEWIRRGWLRPRSDVPPLPAFPGEAWVLMDLVPPPDSAAVDPALR